jgi:hypothetical protein
MHSGSRKGTCRICACHMLATSVSDPILEGVEIHHDCDKTIHLSTAM